MSGVQNVHTVLLNLPFWPEMDRLAMTILHRMFEVPQLFQYATCDDCLQDDIVQAVLCCIVCAVLHRDIHTHSPYHAIPESIACWWSFSIFVFVVLFTELFW